MKRVLYTNQCVEAWSRASAVLLLSPPCVERMPEKDSGGQEMRVIGSIESLHSHPRLLQSDIAQFAWVIWYSQPINDKHISVVSVVEVFFLLG